MPENTRACVLCEQGFTPARPTAKFCSNSCGSQARWLPILLRGEPIPCRQCRTVFTPSVKTGMTCSESCRQQARRQPPRIRQCEDCGLGLAGLGPRHNLCPPCRAERRRARRHRRRHGDNAHTRPRTGARVLRQFTCDACGKRFNSWSATAKLCSKICWQWNARHPGVPRDLTRKCEVCDRRFTASHMRQVHCAKRCSSIASADRRRARLASVPYVPINRVKIFERDRWICQLCFKRIPRRLKSPHPRSAALDHIIPLAAGGGHVPENVHASHRSCNSSKGARGGGEQLLLIG